VKSWVGWRLVYRQALSKFHTLIFASDFIRQEAISIEPLVEARSFVVHSPLDVNNLATPAQKCAARRKLGLPEDCTVIGNAGWLIHRKRFDIFLAVIKQLVGNGKEVVACIAGNGPLEHELRLEAEALGVAKCVRFLGLVSDMEMFYQSIDVLLFNSDWDCFPTTPLESMAYGIPTIASCLNSGLSEIFDDQLLERFYLDEHHIGKLSTRVWECTQTANLGIAQRRRVAEMLDPVRQSTKFWSVLSGNREL
jgi:glycosyltransferase involved in cell wall biosynthesis